MDWQALGSIAAVVIPTVTAVGFVLDQRIQLALERNNATLLTKINGSYVKKDVLNLQVAAIERREEDTAQDIKKLQHEMRHVTASGLGRRTATGQ